MGLFCRIVFSGPSAAMFHVKHSCAKGLFSHRRRPMFHVKPFSPAPLTRTARAMFHVKHFCVKPDSNLRRRLQDDLLEIAPESGLRLRHLDIALQVRRVGRIAPA